MSLKSLIFIFLIFSINSLTIPWDSTTIVERGCNYPKGDLSHFGIGEYSDNAFLIGNINVPEQYQETIDIGKININAINGRIITKKQMYCKFWKLYTFGILYCDFQKFQNENTVYEGIQLLNDGEINFSGNYDTKIMKCNSMVIPPFIENEQETDKKTEKKSEEKEEEKEKEKDDINENIESNKSNNANTESSEEKDINNEIINTTDEEKNYTESRDDNNEEEDCDDCDKKKDIFPNKTETETKKIPKKENKNILGISTGAALGISAGCFAAAAGGSFALSKILKSGNHTQLSQNENKNVSNKTITRKTKLTLCTLVTVGVTFFAIAGILIPLPILRTVNFDYESEEKIFITQAYPDEYYILSWNNQGKYGQHLHWCGDPSKNPSSSYDCPVDNKDNHRCWFCQHGSGVSCYLRAVGKEPNEQNIKNAVNDEGDIDFEKLGYKLSSKPTNRSFTFDQKYTGRNYIGVDEVDFKRSLMKIFDPYNQKIKNIGIQFYSNFYIRAR